MARKVLIGVSVVGHAVLFAGLFVSNVWEVDQVDHRYRSTLVIGPSIPAAESGPIAGRPTKMNPKEPKVIVKEPRQPRKEQPKAPEVPAIGGGGGGAGTDPDGVPGGGCQADDPTCAVEPPEVPVPPVLPDPPKLVEEIKPPVQIPPHVLTALRISGETQIQPPREVKLQMVRDRQTSSSAILEVCVGKTGAVEAVRVRRTTKYPGYDQALVDGARRWRYRPHTVDGAPRAVCGTVTFQYAMQ